MQTRGHAHHKHNHLGGEDYTCQTHARYPTVQIVLSVLLGVQFV